MKKKNNIFSDFNKFLITNVQVYVFVLVIIFIIKLVGINYFELDTKNPTVLKITSFINKYKLVNAWYFFTLYIYTYCIVAIASKKKDIKLKVLIYTAIGTVLKVIETYYCDQTSTALLDIGYLYSICFITGYKEKGLIKRTTLIIVLTILYQVVSAITRVSDLNMYDYNFIQRIILDLDYLLLMIITTKIYFEYIKERRNGICTMEAGFSSLKKKKSKTLLKKLQTNYSNFKTYDRKQKAEIIIFIILSCIWNLFTLVTIFMVALLNDTFIECIFITTSFWLTKRVFGKPFHLENMGACFIVSNCSYYILNRITAPLGISVFIPIILGISLSYLTSKLVKKTYSPLYKGMSEELFNESITKVADEGSTNYNVCYDYFVSKENAIIVGRKYHYSEAGVRQIANRINSKIKELNK